MTTPSLNVMSKPNGVRSEDPIELFKQSLIYMAGKGRKKDPLMAVHLCQRAAAQGFDPARQRLGDWYQWGKGVLKDLKRAQYWHVTAVKSFEAKAAQGDARAQFNLGVCYEYGKGVLKDLKLAHQWYMAAAKQGYFLAQYQLGYIEGVPGDQFGRVVGDFSRPPFSTGEEGSSGNKRGINGLLRSPSDHGSPLKPDAKSVDASRNTDKCSVSGSSGSRKRTHQEAAGSGSTSLLKTNGIVPGACFSHVPGLSSRYLNIPTHEQPRDKRIGLIGQSLYICVRQPNIEVLGETADGSRPEDIERREITLPGICLVTRDVNRATSSGVVTILSRLSIPTTVQYPHIRGMSFIIAGRLGTGSAYIPDPRWYLDGDTPARGFLTVLVISADQRDSLKHLIPAVRHSCAILEITSQQSGQCGSATSAAADSPVLPGVRRMVAMQTILQIYKHDLFPKLQFVGIEDDNVAVNNKINDQSWSACLQELSSCEKPVLIARQEQNPSRRIRLLPIEQALAKKTGFFSGKSFFMNMQAIDIFCRAFQNVNAEIFMPIDSHLIWEDCYLLFLLKTRCPSLVICTHGYFSRSTAGSGAALKVMAPESVDKYQRWYEIHRSFLSLHGLDIRSAHSRVSRYIDHEDSELHRRIARHIHKISEAMRAKVSRKKRTRTAAGSIGLKTVPLKLRPYQRDVVANVSKALRQGRQCALIDLPTGAGKTLVLQHVVNACLDIIDAQGSSSSSVPRRVLWLSPGLVLDSQNRESLRRSGLGDLVSRVDFANHQQLADSREYPGNVGVVVVDEAHHAVCSTLQNLINHYKKNGCYIVGATATSFRSDQQETVQLHDLFNHNMIKGPSIEELTGLGYLVPAQFYIKNAVAVADAGSDEPMFDGTTTVHFETIKSVLDVTFIKNRRGIIYCASQAEAKKLCGELNQLLSPAVSSSSSAVEKTDPSVVCVLGETEHEDRERIFNNFHDNDNNLTILVTCATLIEGFDESLLEWVIIAKVIKSELQIYQIVGRGLRLAGEDDVRPHSSKKSCLRAIFLHPVDERVIQSFYPSVTLKRKVAPVSQVSSDYISRQGLIEGFVRYMPAFTRPSINAGRKPPRIFNGLPGEENTAEKRKRESVDGSSSSSSIGDGGANDRTKRRRV